MAVGLTAGLAGTDTLPWEVDRQLLTLGFGEAWRPGPLAVEGRLEAVLRFRLPNEGPVGAVLASLDRGEMQGQFGAVPVPLPGEVPVPECPPDATSCSFDGQTFEVCFQDGNGQVCEGSSVAQPAPPLPEPVPGQDAAGLEVFDHAGGGWLGVDEAFAGGTPTASLVSPLGELFVRVSGELHPFDFSGRGIAVERGAA